ncbi:outer membrane protein TolC [Dysgonomonas sp. PFB1-18]|uniref:TolC family protein n=1 Tax=unclassified Dysgonomonas TaxID=2630389 RepID=UPI0024744488|nr:MULTISPECIES: TolC family protein [unclassified Dysgonomonas]MDH6310818.1 outer membrane protein TolC [Dysgonomonas sp. PF1-14]MDH6340668.1 outer membrane protein TolC [Dysgonomonas sp. PF1-16]MDH6382225.1 outer membrane protein TolC [Dysgonomonas sp. PFB1-18]MDH6399638.1 outer membrane protein TolC [Dysgonomonas sp. PF1-23]
MIKKSLAIISIFIFACISSVTAQQLLSLEQCRQLAIENNKTLKIATEEERVAYYNKKEALSKYFPEIQFVGGYLHNQKNLYLIPSSAIPSSITLPIEIPNIGNTIPVSDEVRNAIHNVGKVDIKNIWAGGFNLTQPIFMGGKIVAYNDLRSYAEELAKTMKETKMTDVIVEVDNAYWQVVSVANKKKLAESYVELMQKMDSDISAMEQEGVVTKADRLSVNVKLNEAEMTLTKAENGLSLAKMLLSQICGLDISDAITLQDENISNVDVSKEADAMPNVDEALVNRTEIRSLELATKIYEKQEKIALADFMPNLAFTANYLWTNPNLFDGYEKKFGGMWNVGVVLKVPLNFFSNSSKLNAAKAETRIKKYELADAKEKITLQINQSAYKLNEAYKKLAMAKKNSEKADENLRYANVGFDEGVIASSDVMTAHTAWLAAHSDLIDAQIDIVLCKIYLNKALGRKL